MTDSSTHISSGRKRKKMGNTYKQKVVVVGAGPVGALAALYAAQRGDDVEIYELRNGM